LVNGVLDAKIRRMKRVSGEERRDREGSLSYQQLCHIPLHWTYLFQELVIQVISSPT